MGGSALSGKRAVVTGSTRGLGFAFARELAEQGASVVINGRDARACAEAAAQLSAGGSIVIIVSGSALYGLVGQCNYAAAKGGMLALTRALSLELRRYQIRVNAVYPTALTDMTRPLFELAPAGALDSWFRPPQDVAPLVTFLASDRSAQITGQVLAFDGRELTVWSHPEPVSAVRRDGRWNSEDMAAALLGEPSPLAALHPDQLGRHVHQALGPRARTAPGGSPGQRGEEHRGAEAGEVLG